MNKMDPEKHQLIQEILTHLHLYHNPPEAIKIWRGYESDFRRSVSGLRLALRAVSETRDYEALDIKLDELSCSDNPNPHSSFKLEKDIDIEEL